MSQEYQAGAWPGNVPMRTIVDDYLQPSLEAVRTWFWGPTAPTSQAQGQPWADTTTGLLRIWDGSSWVDLIPLTGWSGVTSSVLQVGTLAATGDHYLLPHVRTKLRVLEVSLICAAGTTSSEGSDLWAFEVSDPVNGIDLLSSPVQTDQVGVGSGGGEIVTETPYVIIPDQNADLSVGSALKLTATKTGSPGDLTNASVAVTYVGLGV